MEIEVLILVSIAITILGLGTIAWFAHLLHLKTREHNQRHTASLHQRLDRQLADDGYGIERIRTAIAELRRDFVEWWKRQ